VWLKKKRYIKERVPGDTADRELEASLRGSRDGFLGRFTFTTSRHDSMIEITIFVFKK